MSYDGSSAKSYIRHATEKERLDNLAFASFPEDYLPYAAAPGHQRTAAPPPYLLWGDDRRRRPTKKRRKPKCAGALLCAIALVVVAIVAVVAISVYLGVVTNLFRSPVVSVSGRFLASEEFSEELLNTSSSKFLEKAETYQSKVEKAFLSSSLEPSFIAARIYLFRPGLVVFFRVYLDRRKIKQGEGESPPTELVRELVSQKLTADPDSVHIEENEELLSVDFRPVEKVRPTVSSTLKPTTERSGSQRPPSSGGVGEWHPVPIEDSVQPSFAERTPGGLGSVRSPEEIPRRRPAEGFGSVRTPESIPARNPPIAPINREVIGSVRLLEESLLNNPQSNTREGAASVRLLEEPSLRKPQLVPQSGGSPQLPPNRVEGVGSVRLLPESPLEFPHLPIDRQGVGSVLLTDVNPSAPKPFNSEGIGTVRLLDDNPKLSQLPSNTRTQIGPLRRTDEAPRVSAQGNPSLGNGFVRPMEDPPTLAPSVSLVIRRPENRSRSDKLRNLLRVNKGESNTELARNENVGVGSIREIIEEGFPLPLQRESPEFSSRLSDLELKVIANNNSDEQNAKEITENYEIPDIATASSENTSRKENLVKYGPHNKAEDSKSIPDDSIQNGTTPNVLFSTETTTFLTEGTQPQNLKSSLESIIFKQPDLSTFVTEPNERTDSFKNETTSSDDDIHSGIVNYSQYLFPEPHYHTIENKTATNSQNSQELHTFEGHGFHKPLNSNASSTASDLLSTVESSTKLPPTTLTLTSIKNRTSSETMSPLDSAENQTASDTDSFKDTDTYNSSSDNAEKILLSGETVNITVEDASQQAKVVPQLKSDLLSNDIGEVEESGNENDGHLDDEILRHITTLHPHFNDSSTSEQSCPVGSVSCAVTGEGCGVHCDMRKDCPNNEDEKDCLCSDLLRAMGQSQKICDGVDDCIDGSDEANCPWCPSSDYFRCPGSRTCVTKDLVCDGKDDCPGGQDERRCVNLAESSEEAGSYGYRSEGYLIVRKSGQWGKLCLDTLTRSPDLERRIKDLGKAVCSALTYRNMSSSTQAIDKIESETSYYQISTDTTNNRSATSLFEPTPCKGKEVLRVQCKTLECGLRPSAAPSQRRRIVGGKSADGAGSWPWAAALYREGDFQCGAALISDIWLVSAAHCFYSSQNAFWSARLGVLRRGSELPSSGEQVRKIIDIILHPQYEDVGFINDIVLLRMEQAVSFSDTLRPICLPSSPAEDASLWHGRRCSVVGWGKLYEIGHTFPDSLQEVRLPVISSRECQRRSIFLPAYRITPNMFCAGYDRGGRDACLGDSGGPMACQRPADGRWVLLGITSNGDGCGRPNRPGVYSQVAGFLTWIQETISEDKDIPAKTGSESSCSTGVRCRLGRCIPQTRVCDGRRDCASGEDEADC